MQGRIIAESDNSGGTLRTYIWDDGYQPVAQIDNVSGAERVTYLHTDPLGTPVLGTDSAGKIVWKAPVDPFGAGAPSEDPDGDGVVVKVNLRMAGQYYDAESNLHENGQRFYDPMVGRYVTSDPIGLRGGLNTYLYARANPLRYIDPTGLDSQFTVGINLSIGGNPIPVLPGFFGGGGLNIGFTSSGQIIIQAQATGSAGVGLFAGVGAQAGVSKTKCPTKPGISVDHSLQGDFNFGAGPSVGGSVQYDPENKGGGVQAGIGKIGAGLFAVTTV